MIQNKLLTFFYGELVGEDSTGNRYYTSSKLSGKTPRRWVVYKSKPDPTTVPPQWHGWLHYTCASPLVPTPHHWAKDHLPNQTGLPQGYRPPSTNINPDASPELENRPYTPWIPKE